ncbi:RDD family protein [Chloroflexota bacterium]
MATSSQPARYASFWLRLVAFSIDSFVLFIVYLALSVLRIIGEFWQLAGGGTLPVFVASALIFLTPSLYYWLLTGLRGQTLGKMVVGIRVVNNQGNKPGLVRAALRESIGKTISTIVLLLGFFWVIWDDHKQGWHDKLASTYVVSSSY